jgi:hypothetical protein
MPKDCTKAKLAVVDFGLFAFVFLKPIDKSALKRITISSDIFLAEKNDKDIFSRHPALRIEVRQ